MSKEVVLTGSPQRGLSGYPSQYRLVIDDYDVKNWDEKKDVCVHGRSLEYFDGMCHKCFAETNNSNRFHELRYKKRDFSLIKEV